MNALNDKATVISSYLYATTPQRIVPLSCLEAGVTYEVQVQAIDLMNAVSPMTAPVEVTIPPTAMWKHRKKLWLEKTWN